MIMDAPSTSKAMLGYKTNKYSYFIILSDYLTKIYLVTGGFFGGPLSSTEIYEAGQWTEVGALPAAVYRLRGASVQNTVYMLGKSVLVTDMLLILMMRS